MNNLLYILSLWFLRKKVYKMMFSIDLTVSVTATLTQIMQIQKKL